MDLHECLDIMQVWYRDGLMFKVTKDANLLIFKDEFSAMNEMSTRIGYDGFEKLRKLIRDHDVRFANLEMTFHRCEGSPAAASGGTWAMTDPSMLG